MAKVRVASDTILLDQLDQDAPLRQRLAALPVGTVFDLEVEGLIGPWERTVANIDGESVAAIRPTGTAAETCSRYPPGRLVDVWWVLRPETSASFGLRLQFWDIPGNRIGSARDQS